MINKPLKSCLFSLSVIGLVASCTQAPAVEVQEETVEVLGENQLPDWAVNANIYEVNIRQYTPEGTFNAFATHLDRLHDMGVKMLWLMPIYPISTTKKKGSLGSYYAVSDYKAVNPEFGTAEDFKALVEKIHA